MAAYSGAMRQPHGQFPAAVALGALLLAGGAPAAPAEWLCQGADGTVVSAHPDEAAARASCRDRAQAAAGGIFIVVPADAASVPASAVRPVELKPAPCWPAGLCADRPPLSGRRGSWSWVPPTRLENGDIRTDLAHFTMYRQAVGGAPEAIAEISAKVSNVYWGMDIRDANACFWIQAVRLRGTPMPSDSSNRVCIDAAGQLLPRA